MSTRKSPLMAAIGAALLAPTLALASSPLHGAHGGHGAGLHAGPAHGTPARATLQLEARAASPGVLIREGAPLDTLPKPAAPTRSAEQAQPQRLGLSAGEPLPLQPALRGS